MDESGHEFRLEHGNFFSFCPIQKDLSRTLQVIQVFRLTFWYFQNFPTHSLTFSNFLKVKLQNVTFQRYSKLISDFGQYIPFPVNTIPKKAQLSAKWSERKKRGIDKKKIDELLAARKMN